MERHRQPRRDRHRPGLEGERPGKRLTRDDARRIVLATLTDLEATPAETFRTALSADAESDWDPYAKAANDDTWGLYQQNPRWWGTKEQILDPAYATTSFVVGRPGTPGLRRITLTDDPVLDCWRIQGWGRRPDGSPLNPDGGAEAYAEWLAHPSTQNYTGRLPKISGLIAQPFTLDRSQLNGSDKLT